MKRILFMLVLAMGLVACGKNNPDNPQPGPDPKPVGDVTVSGKVKGSDGKAIAGVVVSDGLNCVKTDANGYYELPADLSKTKFVYVSTPSGYSAPFSSGLPEFYKRLSSLTKTDGKYKDVDFTLYKISNPNVYSVIITADPQPRASTAGYDNFAYHSLDCCEDMYKDIKEYKNSKLSGRTVYGICLGDVCHENASLYANYKTGLSTLGYATYNVIGNHDHTYSSEDCEDDFEKVFGPCNYSFDLGGIHYVVLDNMILTLDSDSGQYKSVNDGLTDDIYQWLQNDLSFVPATTTLMVCAHSPMIRHNNSDRTKSRHYGDYKALFQRYEKVHVWAGHVHTSYNYVDKTSPNIESHSVTRTTGMLWTNEYLGSNGTPRGYVVMNVDNGDVTWSFKPIYYQSGKFVGNGSGGKQPDYVYREWDYNSSGAAVMRNDGKQLTDEYQMHIYKPGTYAANDGYVYVNIFLWDELWKTPKLTVNGTPTTMQRVTPTYKDYLYDMSQKEIATWYKANNSTLKNNVEYSSNPGQCFSVFRAYVGDGVTSGSVSVEDRFGNTYTSKFNW